MATKKSSSSSNNSSSSKRDLVWLSRFLAFGALLLAIVVLIIAAISNLTKDGWAFVGYLQLIKDIALIGAIALPAYWFVKGKKQAWRIIYWICLVIVLVAAILGTIVI